MAQTFCPHILLCIEGLPEDIHSYILPGVFVPSVRPALNVAALPYARDKTDRCSAPCTSCALLTSSVLRENEPAVMTGTPRNLATRTSTSNVAVLIPVVIIPGNVWYVMM